MIEEIGHRAREASHVLRQSTGETRRQALLGMAAGVEKAASAVLEANRADMAQAEGEGITGALID
ncbi:MAG: gamma-glutamyl-phosphate reductase, partial [Acidimicrobiia bacterium]